MFYSYWYNFGLLRILIFNGSVLGVSRKKVILQISYAKDILNLLIFDQFGKL